MFFSQEISYFYVPMAILICMINPTSPHTTATKPSGERQEKIERLKETSAGW